MLYPFSFLKAEQSIAHRKYKKEPEDPLRGKFSRDRDRILFSKEFRRLQGKTQVFVAGFDDHTRNRLTHTLEVSQIAVSISKYFGFDLTLTEAIALGHDVGHTPFGHVGERLLNLITNNCDIYKDIKCASKYHKGFKHNWQGLKVVSTLEKISPEYEGLNLTDYTLWGILNHSDLNFKKCEYLSEKGICNYRHHNIKCKNKSKPYCLDFYHKYENLVNINSWTFEALIVKIADEIAQRHHDIEDGLIAGIIDLRDLINTFKKIFNKYLDESDRLKLSNISKIQNINYALHDISSFLLGFYSLNLISNSEMRIKALLDKYEIKQDSRNFYAIKSEISKNEQLFALINFEPRFVKRDKKFQDYLYNRILNSHLTQTMDGKANYILRRIIHAYLSNPKQLPDNTIVTFFKNYLSKKKFEEIINKKNPIELTGHLRIEINNLHNKNNGIKYKNTILRTVVDLVAGMTDSFALEQYKELYEGVKLKRN